MKTIFMGVTGAILIAFSTMGVAGASVLTFDDLPVTESLGTIPNEYGGLNWNSISYRNGSSLPGSGYDIGSVSGDYAAFNDFGEAASISSVNPFNFIGAYLTGAWNDNLNITVVGLLGGVTQFSQTVVVRQGSATWFNFNYTAIDELQFLSFGGIPGGDTRGQGTQFVMDDLTTEAVPEPVTAIGSLLGIGVLGIGKLKRYQKKAETSTLY